MATFDMIDMPRLTSKQSGTSEATQSSRKMARVREEGSLKPKTRATPACTWNTPIARVPARPIAIATMVRKSMRKPA